VGYERKLTGRLESMLHFTSRAKPIITYGLIIPLTTNIVQTAENFLVKEITLLAEFFLSFPRSPLVETLVAFKEMGKIVCVNTEITYHPPPTKCRNFLRMQ
jgi:hypothetical protein